MYFGGPQIYALLVIIYFNYLSSRPGEIESCLIEGVRCTFHCFLGKTDRVCVSALKYHVVCHITLFVLSQANLN